MKAISKVTNTTTITIAAILDAFNFDDFLFVELEVVEIEES